MINCVEKSSNDGGIKEDAEEQAPNKVVKKVEAAAAKVDKVKGEPPAILPICCHSCKFLLASCQLLYTPTGSYDYIHP
jgi:hypothetical protein